MTGKPESSAFIKECRADRDLFARLADDCETGRLRFEEGLGENPMVDATAGFVAHMRQRITDLDALIAAWESGT
jgi:hypothetical protein